MKRNITLFLLTLLLLTLCFPHLIGASTSLREEAENQKEEASTAAIMKEKEAPRASATDDFSGKRRSIPQEELYRAFDAVLEELKPGASQKAPAEPGKTLPGPSPSGETGVQSTRQREPGKNLPPLCPQSTPYADYAVALSGLALLLFQFLSLRH